MKSQKASLEKKIKINGFKWGLLLGIIITALTLVSYYFITGITRSPVFFIAGPIIFRIFIPVFVVLFLCFKVRKNIGGYWTFKQAVTGIFIMLLTAYFVNLICKDLVFDKLIEPHNIEKTQNAAINAKTLNMKKRGVEQKKIDASVADMKKNFIQKNDSPIWGAVMNNAVIILFLFVFALIFSSLLRNAEYVSVAKKDNA